jgi:hypothetical protein
MCWMRDGTTETVEVMRVLVLGLTDATAAVGLDWRGCLLRAAIGLEEPGGVVVVVVVAGDGCMNE